MSDRTILFLVIILDKTVFALGRSPYNRFYAFSVRSRVTEVGELEAGDSVLFQEQQRQLEDLLTAESSAASTKSTIITGKANSIYFNTTSWN